MHMVSVTYICCFRCEHQCASHGRYTLFTVKLPAFEEGEFIVQMPLKPDLICRGELDDCVRSGPDGKLVVDFRSKMGATHFCFTNQFHWLIGLTQFIWYKSNKSFEVKPSQTYFFVGNKLLKVY